MKVYSKYKERHTLAGHISLPRVRKQGAYENSFFCKDNKYFCPLLPNLYHSSQIFDYVSVQFGEISSCMGIRIHFFAGETMQMCVCLRYLTEAHGYILFVMEHHVSKKVAANTGIRSVLFILDLQEIQVSNSKTAAKRNIAI